MAGRVVRGPVWNSSKKKRVFYCFYFQFFRIFYFYFLAFPLYFISRKYSIGLLSTYLYIYLIYIEGSPRGVGYFIFIFCGTNYPVRQVRNVVPTFTADIQGFFDAAERAWAPRGRPGEENSHVCYTRIFFDAAE